ncbi:signal transduction histidine kinase [Flavobacteriaceae bacterium MAR_2009_75]|nr:signal transduction histidine kinase [Flavobacteriaceae bacterium MAR_2009_75]
MKLLNYTTKYFALLLIVLISVWAVIFYFAMLDEIYDSLDDGLDNQKTLVIQKAKRDSTILQKSEFEDGNYTIVKINAKNIGDFTDSYRDTLMYMQNEDEFEPIRVLETVFRIEDSYYKMKLITSMVEEDDQIENLVIYIIGLYLILVASIVFLNNLVLKKVWKPFYDIIEKLKSFRIEKDEVIKAEPTFIDEFKLLNDSVEKLTQKSHAAYLDQKQFIENAAHELQTPLAISANKLELLLETGELSDAQSKEVTDVLNNLGHLTRLNRSLLLLSKIENQQYEDEQVDFVSLIEEVNNNFEDFIAHRAMEVQLMKKGNPKITMNRGLAVVLFTNLLKNAIVHGEAQDTIIIEVLEDEVQVKNSGEHPLDQSKLFKRFKNATVRQKSTGLGLSIAKAIADKYQMRLSYSFTNAHIFSLKTL